MNEAQGETLSFDGFTERGINAFSPWCDPQYSHSLGQINIGYVPLSKADTFYSGSIVNISKNQFLYYSVWFNPQATSYLADKFHLTVNQPSAVSSVAFDSFNYYTTQARSARNPAVKSGSVPDEISTKSVSNRTIQPTESSTKTPPTPTPSLGFGNPIYWVVDAQGGVNAFDGYTAKGFAAFAPWAELSSSYGVGQINLGYIPISKADTYYSGSTVNISRLQFNYYSPWFSGDSSYLADQWHLTANLTSALSSVSNDDFSYTAPLASVSNQSLKSSTSVPNQSAKTARNRTINSVENPPTSSAKSTKTSTNITPNNNYTSNLVKILP